MTVSYTHLDVYKRQEYMLYGGPPTVKAYGKELQYPWAGGLNNPQPCLADLNGDCLLYTSRCV